MNARLSRAIWPASLALLLLAITLFGVSSSGLGRASAAPNAAIGAGQEVWRLGVVSEGGVGYEAVIGRVVSSAAVFRSARPNDDTFFIFPAPASPRTVVSAAYTLAARSGSYSGSASMALEVRAYDGTVRRTLTTAPVDIAAATVGAWAPLSLDADAAVRALGADEYLVVHIARQGGPGGDMDLRPMFEVVVE